MPASPTSLGWITPAADQWTSHAATPPTPRRQIRKYGSAGFPGTYDCRSCWCRANASSGPGTAKAPETFRVSGALRIMWPIRIFIRTNNGESPVRLPRLAGVPQGKHPDVTPQGEPRGQQRAGHAVLADRPRYPRSPDPGGMGFEGRRATCKGPAHRISGNDRTFPAQPQVHAGVRRGLAGLRICAAGCCTNSLVPQLHHPGQGKGASGARVVRPEDHRERLEPVGARGTDRDARLPARRGRADELRPRFAGAAIRPGQGHPEGSVRLRFPRYHRGDAAR